MPVGHDYELEAQLVGDFPRLWRGSSDETRKALISTMFEEIRVRRDKIVQVKPRPRYVELVTLGMLNGLRALSPEAVGRFTTTGGRCGRGERT